MTWSERVLYHQVHPLKLAADIGSTIVSVPILWNGDVVLGLIVALGTPVVGSAVVLSTADLNATAASDLGAYLRRYMTPPVQGLRLAMGLLVLWAAWAHAVPLIAAALLIVALAWGYGLVARRRA